MAASQVIQYVTFPASESFKNNQGQYQEALKTIATIDGHQGTYTGVQIDEEGAKQGYFITIWQSAEHHRKFRETAAQKFGDLLVSMKESIGGQFTRHQFVILSGTPTRGLESKTAQLVMVTPKAGASLEEVEDTMTKVGDLYEADGHPTAGLGDADGSDFFFVIVGYKSPAERAETIKKEHIASALKELKELADLDIAHANLTKHA